MPAFVVSALPSSDSSVINYSPFYDVDGSGSINILDVIDVRNRHLTSLPAGTP
jgi:hypothetical protein